MISDLPPTSKSRLRSLLSKSKNQQTALTIMKKNFRQPLLALSLAFAPLLFLGVAASLPAVHAADIFGPPSTIDYQGSVLDSNGNPLAADSNANYNMEFRLYDAQTGGTVVWAEKQLVTVSKGKFSVRLGEGDAIPADGGLSLGTVDHTSPGLPGAFAGSERYLGVTVIIPGQQSGEIAPRLAFLASPFSYVAATAQVAQSVSQPAGSPPSNLNIGTVAFSNTPMTATGTISTNAFAVLVDSTAAPVTATLPAGTAVLNRQLLVTKKDVGTKMVMVAPPSGGTINGMTNLVCLKVRGESVTLQNIGANDWWIVADSRDKTPVGTVITYTSATPPAGYLPADGALPARADYPELVTVLSTAWGVPTDATKFRVPDLRGAFLRGVDGIRGSDPDSAARTNDYPGSASGNNVGSFQDSAFASHFHAGTTGTAGGHTHSVSVNYSVSATQNGSAGFNRGAFQTSDRDNVASWNGVTITGPEIWNANANYGGEHSHSFTTDSRGASSETRPKNYAVKYCIKY